MAARLQATRPPSRRQAAAAQDGAEGAGQRRRVRGSTSSAASPATSGRLDTLLVTTGVPQAIASSTGRPKPSYERRVGEDGCRAVERRQVSVRHVAGEDDAGQATLLDELRHIRGSPACLADDHQLLGEALGVHDGIGLDQAHQVLARLQVADGQHIGAGEAVGAPRRAILSASATRCMCGGAAS